MAYTVFEIERDGHVATLWLSNPARRNAMGPAFWAELPQAMAELSADDAVRAIVVAGRGQHFTTGLDLTAMAGIAGGGDGGGTSGVARRMRQLAQIERLQRSITSVADCPKPVLAAVHGYCLGGGVDLITACDVRLAAADAVFSIRETRIAIVADVGTLQRLPGIVGRGLAAELALTGDDFGAERACAIGLVNAVHPDAEATVAAARAMAGRMAENSPLAVQGTKRVLRYCEGKSVEDGLAFVATWNAAFLDSEDLREAMRAFVEKRPARFTGA
ncbi:MAG TPA: crotonase/enoyl-CoA hydratase family protein [Candidatus Limnocylindria bacterium]|nr:crotonase/enoyl-CoA hydratase family protein [Candidatus Limnocylindria bacterium]